MTFPKGTTAGEWEVYADFLFDEVGNVGRYLTAGIVTVGSVSATAPPGPPRSVTATAGDTQATVSWLAPTSSGSSAITGYTVTASPGGHTCTTSGLTCTVTGLTNGTAYTFTVTATNTAGTSPASSASTPITPSNGLPSAPRSVTATSGDSQASVSWLAPTSPGSSAITSYTVTASPGGRTCTTSGLTCTVTGLTHGTAYTFTVTATNTAGTSPASSASNPITPQPGAASPPGAVTSLQVRPVRRGVVFTWRAPSQLGGPGTLRYEYRTAGSARWIAVEGQSLRIGGAKGERIVLFVRAVNEAGPGQVTRAVGRIP